MNVPWPHHLDLGEVIDRLGREDAGRVLPIGFKNPHSSRAYYHEVAFEPAENITVGEMLEAATSAVGSTYHGWKGGEYTMSVDSGVWLAEQGTSGEELGALMLELMLR